MLNQQDTKNNFSVFKKKYSIILDKFLNDKTTPEIYLHEGYKLGRDALIKNIGILNVAAIHHDCLITYLEKLETDEHLIISEKANVFFEEILSSFQMTSASDFREAINLLNLRSLEFAGRIRALQKSIKEKESLLKEVYHRVKNNLQVVSSLLNLQAEATQEPIAEQALVASSARVKSMALIHEMLYQTENNFSNINMENYIDNLFRYLFEIYNIGPDKIKLTTDIDDTSLNIDTAIPCALIMNELISNIFKYAFPINKSGEIKCFFKKQEDNVVLIISDNGKGISPEIDINNTSSLGMRLINNLTKQLGGNIMLDRNKGSKFTLTFKEQKS